MGSKHHKKREISPSVRKSKATHSEVPKLAGRIVGSYSEKKGKEEEEEEKQEEKKTKKKGDDEEQGNDEEKAADISKALAKFSGDDSLEEGEERNGVEKGVGGLKEVEKEIEEAKDKKLPDSPFVPNPDEINLEEYL